MRQFKDDQGAEWVASVATEKGGDYKGRFYLSHAPRRGGGRKPGQPRGRALELPQDGGPHPGHDVTGRTAAAAALGGGAERGALIRRPDSGGWTPGQAQEAQRPVSSSLYPVT